MTIRFDQTDPLQRNQEDFLENIRQTFEPLGGQITGTYEGGRTARLSFGETGMLDVTAGPGGNPIVGRGGGMLVFPRMTPRYGEHGPLASPTVTPAWNVLGGIVNEALKNATGDADPAQTFGNTINFRLGTRDLREGQGIGAQYLPYGYEQSLPQAALRRFASTTYAEQVPMAAMREVFPGYVAQGAAHAGLMPITPFESLQQAAIGGAGLGGGKAKQTGIRPYEGVSLGGAPWQTMTTATGLSHQAQMHDIVMPLGGSIGPAEGQVGIAAGLPSERRRPVVKPLTGWTTEQLGQVAGIRQGAASTYGSELDVLADAEGTSLYAWRSPHYSFAQIASGHISLPESYGQTTWWGSLSEQQRGIFQLTGGAVAGGKAVPALHMDVIERRAAGGATSLKGMGQKAFGYEVDIGREVSGLPQGFTPNLLFEEGPKEWFTRATAIGAGLGILQPGQSLMEGGKLNRGLATQVAQGIAEHTKLLSRTYEVTPGLAEPYLSGRIPGVTGTRWQESGNLQVTRQFQAYVGPSAEWTRAEYPMAQSKLNPEEMGHIRSTNPALAARVEATGYLPEAHTGVSQAYWASYGMIDRPQGTVEYGDVRDVVQGLAGTTQGIRGGLAQLLAESDFAKAPIAMPGGMVLPSARNITQMSASNVAGEEVSKLVTGWERALMTNDPAYLQTVAGMMSGKGWVKELQSIGVPGVAGPGVGRGNVPVGEVQIGEAQLHKLAREVYGHNPSEAEMAEMRQTIQSQDVIGKMTRFPQSDVYNQNELYMRLRMGGGENEIATNPLIAAMMRGDYDADIYRWFTTSMQAGPGGLQVSNEGMGPVATEQSVLTSLIGMMETASPQAVAQAREEVAGLNLEGPEETRLGAVLNRANYFANELRKHVGKEAGTITGEHDVAGFVMGQLSKAPTYEAAAAKQEALYEAKGLMGRTYNALRRSTAERARSLYGGESPLTREVFAAAAGGYQPALDVGTYSPNLPLGSQSGDVDPAISFGTARLMEAFGTQSFLHGGGFMANITGTYKYGKQRTWEKDRSTGDLRRQEKMGYSAPWIRMQGEGVGTPLAMMRNVLGQAAVFGGEYTPSQMAAMLTTGDPEQMEAVGQAVGAAREWAGGQDVPAEQALGTKEGMRHLGAIWRAAGMTDESAMWQSQAPLVGALRDTMLLRTREQIHKAEMGGDAAYQELVRGQLRELEPSFAQLTGTTLESAMAGAVQRQGGIDVMAGNIQSTERTPTAKAQALARLVPGAAGGEVRDPRQPEGSYPIWASELAADDPRMFANLLQRRHDIKGGWGGTGTAIHEGFEAGLKERLGDKMISEDQLATRGTLRSLFGMQEDIGFSGRPDILTQAEGGGYNLYDVKSYGGPYDPKQLQVYAAALGQQGYDIRSASYVHVPRPGEGVDPATYAREQAGTFLAGGLERSEVPLAGTQEERLAVARGHLSETVASRRELEPLLERIAAPEAQRLAGLGYGESGHVAGDLLSIARRRATAGVQGTDIASPSSRAQATTELSPLERMSQQYGIDLSALGVKEARVLGQGEYAKETAPWGAQYATTGGYTIGQGITVRQATEDEAKKYGIDVATLTRRRLAHESGHALAGSDPELMKRAMHELDMDLAQGILSEDKLRAMYGEQWREKGASERIAMGIGQSFGALGTYGENVGSLDVTLNRLGSQAQGGGPVGAGTGGVGGGPVGPPDAFLSSPPSGGRGGQGRGGGFDLSKMSQQEAASFFGQMTRTLMGWDQPKDPLKTIGGKRLAFEIAGGNLEALTGPTAEGLVRGGQYEEYFALQEFQGYMMKGGVPKGSSKGVVKQLHQMAGDPRALQSLGGLQEFGAGLTEEEAGQAMERVRGGMVPKMTMQNLEEFGQVLSTAAKRVEEHGEQIVSATQHYEKLNKEQQRAYKDVMGDVGTLSKMEQQLTALGPAGQGLLQQYAGGFQAAGQVQQAIGAQAQAGIQGSYQQLFGGNLAGRVARGAVGAVGDIGKQLTSGWGMMWLNRVWGMTGGAAIGAEQAAMSQEMSVQQALGSWSGGVEMGPLGQGLMGIQARKQAAQAAMGRGAYMGYGPIQEQMAGRTGEMAGLAGPAVGAGMIAGHFLGGPVGWATGLATAGIGLQNWAGSIAGDELELQYRAGGGAGDKFSALMAGFSGGKLPGMKEGLSYNPLTHPISGLVNLMGWSGGDMVSAGVRGGGWLAQQGQGAGDIRAGNLGALAGDSRAQALALRHWAEQSDSFLGVEQLVGQAGQWQQYAGGITQTSQLPTKLFEQLAIRGMSTEQVGGLAMQLGGLPSQTPQLAQALVNAPQGAQMALGQYAGAGQLGLANVDWFAQNLGQMQQMTGWQSNRFQQMMGGDRGLWSRYAAGQDLGLTGTAMDVLNQVGAQPWMMSAEPDTGYGLHTTTGARYAGALATPAARQGGMRGIQWAQIQLAGQVEQEQEGRQWDRFQMGYAYQAGAPLAGYPGTVPAGLAAMARQTGGQWGLQDQSRAMQYGWQQYQFGYQEQMFNMQDRHWQENWQANYGRMGVQAGWEDQQDARQRERNARGDEHWLFQYGLSENVAELRFGWEQEDLDQSIRYATGRQKMQLMKQKERSTISESMRQAGSDESKDYWEDQRKWRDEDLTTAKKHRDQVNQWREEDMQRSKRQHEETVQSERQHFDKTKQHSEEEWQLENRRIQLEREYWRESQKAQADDMNRAREINDIQRRLREDQYKLSTDAQDAVARFNIGIGELGSGIDAVNERIRAFNAAVGGSRTSSTSTHYSTPTTTTTESGTKSTGRTVADGTTEYHEGGPVGMVAGSTATPMGEVPATLEEGEYVVPRNGSLVMRDERVVDLLGRIARLLEEGNGRFTIMVQNPERGVSNVQSVLDAAYNN